MIKKITLYLNDIAIELSADMREESEARFMDEFDILESSYDATRNKNNFS